MRVCILLLLLASIHSDDSKKVSKKGCKNPKGKLGQSVLKDCSQAICKPSGWEQCDKTATVDLMDMRFDAIEKKMDIIENMLGQIQIPFAPCPIWGYCFGAKTGNELGHWTGVGSWEDCAAHCQATAGCTLWSAFPTGTDQDCWAHSGGYYSIVQDTNAICGTAFCTRYAIPLG
eukprot:GFUD01036754.1.p1 GENE.GFUD01036754.1~~GFUD01036754.1.p1  ORF type:complete len:174 (-),score=3.39 GFUD01036754.1:46-567(-)